MAEPYLERLSQIVDDLDLSSAKDVTLQTKHFFSGAALYVNGKICGLVSPAGFAIKLPERVRRNLIDEGKGTEFRFFAEGPIKRQYLALPASTVEDDRELERLLNMSIDFALEEVGAA